MEARPSVLDQLKKQNLFEWYYILVMCGYLLTLVTDAMRPGVFAAILLLGVAAELVLRGRVSFRHMIDMLAAAYFIYNLLSVIWLTRNGFPADIYAEEFVSSILPMVFYMVGKSAGQLTEKFYKKYIAALLLIGAAGFLLYVFAPQFYLDYLVKWSYISKADAPTMRIRMHSVIGSTILGFLSVCGMLASSWFVMQKKERLKGAVLFAVCFLLAMLSNQRSAMVAAILVVLYINHLIFFEFRLVSKKYFIGECGLIAAAFLGLCICCFDVVLKIYYRLISLPGAIGQRSEQWVAAVNNMFSSWLGNGLGANGHK
ncbi:MAG TPA: hypothetical protein PLU43_09770, partial [Lachnospiraceae bacterium]|nr:hypothetical protein [Lachnospiraceae bacterium]